MGALAGVLPSSHLNQLRGERVKDLTLDEFVDSDGSFESNKLLEYSSNDSGESGETEQTTMLPIFFPESEDQRMRFRYALSQILLPPPAEEEENEQPGSSSLKLPPAVKQERASMLLRGENSFHPYDNLYEEGDFGEEEELEGLEGSVDELPEIDVWERYRGPNVFDVETGLEDFEDEEDEDNIENEEDEGDEGEWQEEEAANEAEEKMDNDE